MNTSGILSLITEALENVDKNPDHSKILLQKVLDNLGRSEEFLNLADPEPDDNENIKPSMDDVVEYIRCRIQSHDEFANEYHSRESSSKASALMDVIRFINGEKDQDD